MVSNLFLTGPRGVGKTTLLFRCLAEHSLDLGGFTVKKVYQGGLRVSLCLVDLHSGRRATLVTFPSTGRRQVQLDAFLTVGLPAIRWALAHADVVVLDELGRWELAVPAFLQAVIGALDGPQRVTGVLKQESNWFLDAVASRPDTRVIPVRGRGDAAAFAAYRRELARILPYPDEPVEV